MKKNAFIFIVGVLAPSLLLAWLAMRSLSDQQYVFERQQELLLQGVAENAADHVQTSMKDLQQGFAQEVEVLLSDEDPRRVAPFFNEKIRTAWSLAAVGFAVTLDGRILAPSLVGDADAKNFRRFNEPFLSNWAPAEVYPQQQLYAARNEDRTKAMQVRPASEPVAAMKEDKVTAQQVPADKDAGSKLASKEASKLRSAAPVKSEVSAYPSKPSLAFGGDAGDLGSSSASAAEKPSLGSEAAEARKSGSPAPAPSGGTVAMAARSRYNLSVSNSAPTGAVSKDDSGSGAVGRRLDEREGENEIARSKASQRASIEDSSVDRAADGSGEHRESASELKSTDALSKARSGAVAMEGTLEGNAKKVFTRSVAPQKDAQSVDNKLSSVAPAEAEFRQIVGEAMAGSVARFQDNRLSIMFWYRSPRDPQLVFGAELDMAKLTAQLEPALDRELRKQVCLAIIDDKGKPVSRTQAGFETNWKRPFVASEIGEVLPHWESAVYWLNPGEMNRAVSNLRVSIGSLIAGLLGAIALGGWLLFADLRRQLLLARQKTDFVSNVSHELKTPLTSIRMFSELLAEGRVTEPEKQRTYLQIICGEAARLTRLINNVLDFSRLERGEAQYHLQSCAVAELVDEVVANYQPHLEAAGFAVEYKKGIESGALRAMVDRDAVCQILVNLLSNAEKYGGDARTIEVCLSGSDARVRVEVRDRGLGVPRGQEKRIFEEFHRAHDSLNSGIQGAGLGLSLARRIARAHGGDIGYEPRSGGGSCFYLELPSAH